MQHSLRLYLEIKILHGELSLTTTATSKKLYIDYFNDFPLTLEGAESIHVYEICTHLQKLNFDVTLFSPHTVNSVNPTFKFIQIWTPSFLISIFYQLFVIPKIFNAWKLRKPDAVYMRVTPLLIIPVVLAKLYSIPIIPEINGTLHLEIEKAHTNRLRRFVSLLISDAVERKVYNSASTVITVTTSLKDYIVERYSIDPAKIVVIENGVDSEELKPIPTKSSTDAIVVGYVGGVVWWQGLTYLIDAMKILRTKTTKIQLVIVGDGPERVALEQQVEQAGLNDMVEFRGKINHSQVNQTINSFDICIAYYVKARAGLNSPFKVYEYLACGKPVIVSDIAGTGDTFKTVTKVVDAEDSNALAAAILELVKNDTLRISMGKSARSYILDGHTWGDVATALANEIYVVDKRSIISNRND